MSDEYFIKFPNITYDDIVVTDISRRVVFDDAISKIPTFFYPYELKSGIRSDTLSYSYYDDPMCDWVIYLTNGIIDPYHGWYLSTDDFEKFIKKKYGSIEKSQQRIKYWALDSFTGENNITVSYFNNNIPDSLKKYFIPVFGVGTNIIAYKKREDDWTVNTNKIVEYRLSSDDFKLGERVILKDGINNILGYAEIIKITETSIIVENVYRTKGDIAHIIGEESLADEPLESENTIVENISDEEVAYWVPVYYYDYEYEKNEANKFVRLLDAKYLIEATESVRIKLSSE